MEFKNINCPECGLNIEYWTKNNFIECTKCKNKIKVEPWEDIVEEVREIAKSQEDENNETCDYCKFHIAYFDEIDGKLYHDGCYCKLEGEGNEEVSNYHEDNCEFCTDEFIKCPYFQILKENVIEDGIKEE